MNNIQEFGIKIFESLEKVIIGKHSSLELVVIGLICQGHVLIEDVPGVGKTVMAKTLARSLGCEFSRIQFTPDMLPSDVTGVSIYNQENKKFEFRPGPIFGQVVLADEINRATPKTQAALLEAMDEQQVTVDGITHKLPHPFIVLATQNPIEYEGTFTLPEAQLDRFFLRVRIGYPALNDEIQVLDGQRFNHPIDQIKPIFSSTDVLAIADQVKSVYIAPTIVRYIVELTHRTRISSDVYLGASPRGSLALFRGGQARAALLGREYVLPDDIKALAEPILGHRIIVNPAARLREVTAERIVQEILLATPVPGGSFAY